MSNGTAAAQPESSMEFSLSSLEFAEIPSDGSESFAQSTSINMHQDRILELDSEYRCTRRRRFSATKSNVCLTRSMFRGLCTTFKAAAVNNEATFLDTVFDELDVCHTGVLSPQDIHAFFRQAADHINLDVEDETIDAAVEALMANAGATDCITSEQFSDLFVRYPALLRVFETEEGMASLRETVKSQGTSGESRLQEIDENIETYQRYTSSWLKISVETFWLLVYLVIMAVSFGYKFSTYAKKDNVRAVFGYALPVARGASECLNVGSLAILLPVLRHLLTYLRVTRLRFVVPFDANIDAHMVIGVIYGLFVLVHVGAHLVDLYRFGYASEDSLYALFGNKFGTIPESPSARWRLFCGSTTGVTGIIMVVLLFVAYPFTLVRRKHFDLFWTTHHLLLVMLIVLCVHGSGALVESAQSWYWIVPPLIIYALGRLLRETPMTKVAVQKCQIKKGGIIYLRLARPPGWSFHIRAGMYSFLKVEQLSHWQWHPFTMTSAPDDGYAEFHIFPVGDWTEDLQNLVSKAVADESERFSRELDGKPPDEKLVPTQMTIRVDGPIGASSQGFSDYEVVVLIGAGIGITPMISVFRDLLRHPVKMKRTYFYWTVRNHASFQWFTDFLDDIYTHDLSYCLEVRHFLTSVTLDDRDFGAVLLAHATKARHMTTGYDLVLGRMTRHAVQIGRPNWDKELAAIREEAKALDLSRIGTFLCGPAAMAKEIDKTVKALNRKDDSVTFHFTKEIHRRDIVATI